MAVGAEGGGNTRQISNLDSHYTCDCIHVHTEIHTYIHHVHTEIGLSLYEVELATCICALCVKQYCFYYTESSHTETSLLYK